MFHLLWGKIAFRDFLINLNLNLIVKFTAIDEVSDGKLCVVEQVVEGFYQMKVFGQLLVEAFVPVGRRTIHADEVVKGLVCIPL